MECFARAWIVAASDGPMARARSSRALSPHAPGRRVRHPCGGVPAVPAPRARHPARSGPARAAYSRTKSSGSPNAAVNRDAVRLCRRLARLPERPSGRLADRHLVIAHRREQTCDARPVFGDRRLPRISKQRRRGAFAYQAVPVAQGLDQSGNDQPAPRVVLGTILRDVALPSVSAASRRTGASASLSAATQ